MPIPDFVVELRKQVGRVDGLPRRIGAWVCAEHVVLNGWGGLVTVPGGDGSGLSIAKSDEDFGFCVESEVLLAGVGGRVKFVAGTATGSHCPLDGGSSL